MASQTTDWRLGDVTSLQPHAVVGAWVAGLTSKSQAREFSLFAELQTLASVEMEKFGWEEVAVMEDVSLAPCGPGSLQQRGE